MYARCSTNFDCGCLPFSSADEKNGICAYLHLNASKLNFCDSAYYYCDQPYTICVHHPKLSTDRSLCYPTGMASFDLCPPLNTTSSSSPSPPIDVDDNCFNITWMKSGITVAGSNYSGNGLDQLRNPTSVIYDLTTDTLYVSDNGNARIVTWKLDAKRGTVIAGDNGQGNRTDQLGWVSDMLLDSIDGSLIICDSRNRRIIRWRRRAQQGEIMIDNIYCTGFALDHQGLLYVAEHDNHRVSRWILGENTTYDHVVAGGNGRGNRFDQLYEPSAVFVDQNRAVYVTDFSNDRIMKWTEGANEGIIVGKLRWPKTVYLDRSGSMYSIDGYYSRVIRWTPNQMNGTVIIGEQQYTLSQATDLAFDRNGNIFVSNHGTSRIDKFDINRRECSL